MTMIYCAGVGGDNQSCGRQQQCANYRPWWENMRRVDINLCRSIEPGKLVAFVAKEAATAPVSGQQELFA